MAVDQTPAEQLKRRLRHDLAAALKAKQRDEARSLPVPGGKPT